MNQRYTRGLGEQLARLRTKWEQAHVTDYNGNGERLAIVPSFLLPPGWNATICTVLWLVRVSDFDAHVSSCLEHFYVDIPLRLADDSWPHYSRAADDVRIPGFPQWRDLTRFHWKAQMWDPNHDTLYTHMMIIRNRLRPAR